MKKNCFSYRGICRILLVGVVLVLIPSKELFSQTDFEYNMATPESWSFMRYGNSQPKLYTGTVSVDIPVYHYKDNDFDLPISLGYASNGLLPHIQTGPLGLGWFLNASGRITREINGVPDENDGDEKGFKLLSYRDDVQSIPDTSLIHGDYDVLTYKFNDPGTEINYEAEPDIFHFNFGQYQGSFCLGYGKEIHVFGTNFPHGEIQVDLGKSTEINDIIIKTGDGYQYRFEREYESKWYTNTTWILKTITAPNNRFISFDYYRPSYPNPTIVSRAPMGYRFSFGAESTILGHEIKYSSEANINNYTVRGRKRTSYLTRINIDGKFIVDFTYSDKELEDEYIGAIPLRKLDRIDIRDNLSGNELKSCVLRYYPSNSSGCKKLFLHKVSISGEGDYVMNYHDRTQAFPQINTYSIDHWGYYNGNTVINASTFLPDVEVDNY